MARWLELPKGWAFSDTGTTNGHCKTCSVELKGKDVGRYEGDKGTEYGYYCRGCAVKHGMKFNPMTRHRSGGSKR